MSHEPFSVDPDTTWVTVNKRLAAELRRRHDETQAGQGLTAWPTPDILPWGAWLRRGYTLLVDRGHCRRDLLSRHQELALWESVIADDETTLLRPGAAAELASDAFDLCCRWSIDIDALATSRLDTRLFARWARAFTARLERHGYLVQAQLVPEVRGAVVARHLPLPAKLYVAGIDNPSPAEQDLFDALAAQGVRVCEAERPPVGARRHRVAARDTEHEVRLAAQWAGRTLSQRPHARLAIVSATLGAQRATIERVLTQTLAPDRYLFQSARPLPFNLSLGESLGESPMIDHALTSLRLLSGRLALAEIGKLLRSPFIGGHAHEAERRARLDVLLRADGLPRVDPSRLIARLRRLDPGESVACPDLLQRLEEAQRVQSNTATRLAPSAWADRLREQLKTLGWPGDSGLDSVEFQQYQRFLDLFDELAALTKVRQRLTRAEAVQRLVRIAADTVFQPQTASRPLQVLGPLEAAGLRFDAIWLLGVDERHWPATPRPNPLLPAGLQRELDMPHASAERELAFAIDLLAQLQAGTTLLIASHPKTVDEQRIDASPLVVDWPGLEEPDLAIDAPLPLYEASAVPGSSTPMPAPTARRAPSRPTGGAMLLAAQASCPFAAVARHRLQVRALAEPTSAPDAALVGTLVHRLLQRVWERLEGSAGLIGRGREDLDPLVRPLAVRVLDEARLRRPDLFTPRFCELESERLVALVLDWLDVERQRQQGFEVLALERDQAIELSGIELRTRADRIDRLDDGSVVVIDYKTGREVHDTGWFEERVTEPQLPLYALAAGDRVGATLLARVRNDARGCRFVGVSRMPDFGAGVDGVAQRTEGLGWDALHAHWQTSIQALAREFAAGRADPTPSPESCRYCDLGGFCRVAERGQGADDD